MAYSDVALLLALTLSVALAYPAKDDEAYYNRLHEYQDSYGKDVRNLDGIDGREEPRPLFSFLTKTNQAESSEKGPQTKFDFGSSSHLDGIGGGHLVREFDIEQGLAPSVLDVLLPEYVNVGEPRTFGVVHKYPLTLGSETLHEIGEVMKGRFQNPDSARTVLGCFKNVRCDDDSISKLFVDNGLGDGRPQHPVILRHVNGLGGIKHLNSDKTADSFEEEYLSNHEKYLDSIGGGHLLSFKKDLDSIGGGHLLNYKKDLDSIGGGHLLSHKKDLDSIGGGHLLNYKKDSIGDGHLSNHEKDLGSIGGGHLLSYKKDLDSIGGGHLLNYKKDLDSIGGGHLLSYKKDLDSIGGGHLLSYKKDLDSSDGGNVLYYKKDLDSIGGGHLLNYKKDLDSIGGGHLLSYKKDLDSTSGNNLFSNKKDLYAELLKRYIDSLGGGHLSNANRHFDYLLEKNVKRGSFQALPYGIYKNYYSGSGLPLKSSRHLCTNSRWFQNLLNNYLAKEELKTNHNKASENFKSNEINELYGNSKDKNQKSKVESPRWLDAETKPEAINEGIKGLFKGLAQTPSVEDLTESPFRGIIELSKVYIPNFLTQNDR